MINPTEANVLAEFIGAKDDQIRDLRAEIERLRALLRRHHLRGAFWDSQLAAETRAALEAKP